MFYVNVFTICTPCCTYLTITKQDICSFIIIYYLTPSLAIFHAYRSETISN